MSSLPNLDLCVKTEEDTMDITDHLEEISDFQLDSSLPYVKTEPVLSKSVKEETDETRLHTSNLEETIRLIDTWPMKSENTNKKCKSTCFTDVSPSVHTNKSSDKLDTVRIDPSYIKSENNSLRPVREMGKESTLYVTTDELNTLNLKSYPLKYECDHLEPNGGGDKENTVDSHPVTTDAELNSVKLNPHFVKSGYGLQENTNVTQPTRLLHDEDECFSDNGNIDRGINKHELGFIKSEYESNMPARDTELIHDTSFNKNDSTENPHSTAERSRQLFVKSEHSHIIVRQVITATVTPGNKYGDLKIKTLGEDDVDDVKRCKNADLGEKAVSGEQCGTSTRNQNQLTTPAKIHKTTTQVQCQECGKHFSHESNLARHMKTHTGEKPFRCVNCGKCFSRKRYLLDHQQIHSGEKLYKCEVCGKDYAVKNQLARHLVVHSAEKPFKCEDCGKGFSYKNHLSQHVKVHTGERPFKCEQCGKCFLKHSNLNRHIKVHTGEKPHKCAECGKGFSCISKLGIHMRTHTGEKPYKCNQCGNCYRYRQMFKEHLMTHTEDGIKKEKL